MTNGLKREGAIIVNTPKSAKEIRSLLRGYKGRVLTVDARHISETTLGRNFPNTPMLAAAAAVTGIMSREDFLTEMQASFAHKFAKKPEVIKGNMAAGREGNEEGLRQCGRCIRQEDEAERLIQAEDEYESARNPRLQAGSFFCGKTVSGRAL